MRKSDLIKLLHKIDTELQKTNHSNSAIKTLQSNKRSTRRKLYECDCCADATIFKHKGHGGKREKIALGCRREECLYKDYFEDMARREDEKDEEILKRIKNM